MPETLTGSQVRYGDVVPGRWQPDELTDVDLAELRAETLRVLVRCPLIVGFDPDLPEHFVLCGKELTIDGETAQCELGHRWVRCSCGYPMCTGWAVESHVNPPPWLR